MVLLLSSKRRGGSRCKPHVGVREGRRWSCGGEDRSRCPQAVLLRASRPLILSSPCEGEEETEPGSPSPRRPQTHTFQSLQEGVGVQQGPRPSPAFTDTSSMPQFCCGLTQCAACTVPGRHKCDRTPSHGRAASSLHTAQFRPFPVGVVESSLSSRAKEDPGLFNLY